MNVKLLPARYGRPGWNAGDYKDMLEVMRLQPDLAEARHHLTPIINVKG